MNLREYIEKVGGYQTFYRVKDRGTSKSFESQIKLKSKKERNKIANEIQKATFAVRPKNLYIFVSDKSWYIGPETCKIASLVTVSIDKNRGKNEFKKELLKSEKIRKEKLRYLHKNIKPILLKTIKLGLVIGCIIRGDLVDKNRYPNKSSDIDVLILTNFKYEDFENRKKLVTILKKSPCSIALDYVIFYPNGSFSSKGRLLTNKSTTNEVEYTVVSMQEFEDTYRLWKKHKIHISKYDAQNFSNAKILIDKKSSAKRFLRMVLSLSPK